MKITITEYMPENAYVFYEATTATPENAIKKYLCDHGLNEEGAEITFCDGMAVCEEHEVRAYQTTVEKPISL